MISLIEQKILHHGMYHRSRTRTRNGRRRRLVISSTAAVAIAALFTASFRIPPRSTLIVSAHDPLALLSIKFLRGNQCSIQERCIRALSSALSFPMRLTDFQSHNTYRCCRMQQYATIVTTNAIQYCRGGSMDGDKKDIESKRLQPRQQTQQSLECDQYSFSPKKPRLVIEFNTHSMKRNGGGHVTQGDTSTRVYQTIGKRMLGADPPRQLPSLSISIDVNPLLYRLNNEHDLSKNRPDSDQSLITSPKNNILRNAPITSSTTTISYLPSLVTSVVTLLTQTSSLLPPLLIARRTLNFTGTAIIDYFRGRTIRTTFTKLERAYLRYYEFPAVTRAVARIISQIGILMSLSWVVRLWMIWVGSSTSDRALSWPSMVFGVAGIDTNYYYSKMRLEGMFTGVGDANSDGSALSFGPRWNVGLPCHQRGTGVAWICAFIWISTVVGIGHACAMALSVWGGPLRLQATAQHAESPKLFLKRIIHHPIIWFRELEEWKYYSAINPFHRGYVQGNDGTFDPDPLLFPATWLPLRWLQIFALTRAFSSNPSSYRWCTEMCKDDIIPKLMKQYLVQLALGDEWHRVFLGEKRIGLGIIVITSYFVALVWMVVTTLTVDSGAAAMLIPSFLAAVISVAMNFMIFWNRLGRREQRKALDAMGLT